MNKIKTIIAMSVIAISAEAQWMPVGGGVQGEPVKKEVLPQIRDDETSRDSNGNINALVVYQGELYAAGSFKTAGGKKASNIARWNGKEWLPVGNGIQGSMITALCVYKNELYATGLFDKAGNIAVRNIARWNGKTWSGVEGGINQEARALCVYKDELYVAGEFTEAGKQPAESIARWNGSAWHAVGTGLPNNVFALTEYKGELYAGGTFSTDAADNKKENLFRWNGKQWTGVAIFNGAITSLAVNKDKLCASGYFSHANGKDVSMVAETDGKSWSSVGSPIGYYINRARTAVYILFSHENILYAGGEFREAAGISANGVALYDGSGWKAIGAGADGSIHAFAIYNGELYAAGAFDKAGDVEVGNIVKTTISSH